MCNWMTALRDNFNIDAIKPDISCQHALFTAHTGTDRFAAIHSIHFPCMQHPLILHHSKAAQILINETTPENRVCHLCEYMLLIDKIKRPSHMHDLWDSTSACHHFRDFSHVFMYDHGDATGWELTLQQLAMDEKKCRDEAHAHQEEAHNSSGTYGAAFSIDCIFEDKVDLISRRV